jgi:hypothetical protein
MKILIKISLFECLFVVIIILSGTEIFAQNNANQMKVGEQPDGTILVPTNQLLKPAGFQV